MFAPRRRTRPSTTWSRRPSPERRRSNPSERSQGGLNRKFFVGSTNKIICSQFYWLIWEFGFRNSYLFVLLLWIRNYWIKNHKCWGLRRLPCLGFQPICFFYLTADHSIYLLTELHFKKLVFVFCENRKFIQLLYFSESKLMQKPRARRQRQKPDRWQSQSIRCPARSRIPRREDPSDKTLQMPTDPLKPRQQKRRQKSSRIRSF